ncbi:MAG: endolytic transglycosylase MltG [Cytophagales bacterium]|nr:endolytic transglycosylase MltG [Armatimonadota bacterium]
MSLNQRRRGCIGGVVLVFLLGLLAGTGGLLYWRWGSQARGGGSRVERVAVAPGATLATVGEALQERGIVRSALLFGLLGRGTTLKPGVYDVSPSETPRRLLRRMADGDVATVRVTFPEGFTVQKIARRLKDRGIIGDETAFLRLVTTKGDTLRASFVPPRNLEGYLFPDTYRFPIGFTEKQVAQEMLSLFDRIVAKGRSEDLSRSRRSLSEIVTIASLIEREAETEGDRPRIAGVIYNRLARNQRLEIDATVQYARGQHKARLLYRDLEVDSPYNTYRNAGLPPGAICCPGIASIDAALHPKTSPYLYYVAGPDGRSHLFARTFAEHKQNIATARRPRS